MIKNLKSFQFILSVFLSVVLTIVVSALVVQATTSSLTTNLNVDGVATIGSNLTVSGTGNTTIVGNVGIGTSTPVTKLEILGNVDEILRLSRGATTSTKFRVGTDGALVIQNQATDVLIIKNGNVGIGTTPNKELHISSNDSATIKINDSSANGATMNLTAGSNFGKIAVGDSPLIFATNGVTRMSIDPFGNVFLYGDYLGVGRIIKYNWKFSEFIIGNSDGCTTEAFCNDTKENADAYCRKKNHLWSTAYESGYGGRYWLTDVNVKTGNFGGKYEGYGRLGKVWCIQ